METNIDAICPLCHGHPCECREKELQGEVDFVNKANRGLKEENAKLRKELELEKEIGRIIR